MNVRLSISRRPCEGRGPASSGELCEGVEQAQSLGSCLRRNDEWGDLSMNPIA